MHEPESKGIQVRGCSSFGDQRVGFFLALATGFMVGFFVSTRAMVLLLAPVAVIAVEVAYAVLLHQSINAITVLIDLIIVFPTALSINRFMHD
jgi:hypothetical protein